MYYYLVVFIEYQTFFGFGSEKLQFVFSLIISLFLFLPDDDVLKATGNSIHGLQVESGPTTPLPDKKLLVFILDRLQKKDTYGVFSEPVDPEELPDYHEIIDNPMDFATVRQKLDAGLYTYLELFEKDVFLICSNAMEYNSSDTIYFRQARSIQELARKDFENLKQESDESEPQPKIVRRGRPPGKKHKKSIDSYVENIAPELILDTTAPSVGENTNGSSAYNLRKGPHFNKLYSAEAFHGSLSGETCNNLVYDWENEFPASVLKSVAKYGKKHFAVDENKRDTYSFPLASASGPFTLAAPEGEQKQLVEVEDAYIGRSYARSLAQFAADLGPVAWKIALKKIEAIIPLEVKFSPGWNTASDAERSLYCEKWLLNREAGDLTSRPSLPQTISGSNSIAAEGCFPRGDLTINTQSELTSLNSNCGRMRPAATYFQLDQNSSSQFLINGSNYGAVLYTPQTGMLRTPTEMGSLTPLKTSEASQILGTASTSDTAISPTFITGNNSNEANFRAAELGFAGYASFQGLSRHQNQNSHPFSTELNFGFGVPSSSSSVAQVGLHQQPDLALQLRMGRE
ncbi:uncharacterized protein LOC133807375 isoform X2 [Humulus lupulus]|uniref:uncharacterized protein LOC133807375 isoform X2 n=1 Tax=Humulus lupulus TaxID=3486 RepID=UPI002B40069E|nr:uncharacterized protein LOC133807375 isoform X2 [Humulus lupulus]